MGQQSLDHFKTVMLPAWRHTLQVEFPETGLMVEAGDWITRLRRAAPRAILSLFEYQKLPYDPELELP